MPPRSLRRRRLPENFACLDGTCAADPCGAVHCPTGMVCQLVQDTAQCLYPEQAENPYEPPVPTPPDPESDAGVAPRTDDAGGANTGDDAGADAGEACNADGGACPPTDDTISGGGEGCGCRTGAGSNGAPYLLFLALPLLARRRRPGR